MADNEKFTDCTLYASATDALERAESIAPLSRHADVVRDHEWIRA